MSNVISGLPPLDPGRFQTEVSKPAGSGPGFLDTLQKTLDQAQQIQGEASQKVSNLLSGRGSEDIQSVMVAAEKADLSFQLVMQVRNKIVQAYKDISGLQF
ncbi:MAG: flagellar hook-basal body complex protein FliE [Terriglobia bacterium]